MSARRTDQAVFDVDVHMSINPLTGKPFFMPFRQSTRSAMMRSSLAFPIFALLLALGAIMHTGIGARFIAPPDGGGEHSSISIAQFRP